MSGYESTEPCDVCGQRIYLDKSADVLPFPWRNWDDDRLHTCRHDQERDGHDD